jgi:hypothetical protein
VSAFITCQYFTDAQAFKAVTANLGVLQNLVIYASGCTATSTRLPGTVRPGEVPSPIGYPTLDTLTSPNGGPPWDCEPPGRDGQPRECSRRCPNGNTEKLHFDDGISNGKGDHWDYTDCEGTTWYIWPNGTMTPAT